jgi:hypothetical protein
MDNHRAAQPRALTRASINLSEGMDCRVSPAKTL